MAADIYLKFWRRARLVVRRRLLKSSAAKYRLNSGGTVIAIIGGDGAGKSTTVDALYSWLSTYFEVTSVHMGKPDWSRTTLLARGILKIGNWLGLYPVETSMRETLRQKSLISPGYPWLIREVCRARDRYWTYVWARRFAANGGAVILDRFPLPQVRLMDGPRSEQFIDGLTDSPQAAQFLKPQAGGRLATALARMEKNYYRAIVSPEVVVVLRLDPEIAVQRRSDEEPAFVRQRNTEIWELDWADADVHLVDGSKAKEDIQAEIKSLVWSEL